jgi:UDP-2,3-diacylglucosamine pyrophosphatase LpxH
MLDAVIISDLHLGSDNCQARSLCHFLERISTGELATQRLILNGDVFQSIDFRRLKKSHWKVLSHLRKLSDKIEIIWICGNHDGSAEIVSHLLGVTVTEEHILVSGPRRILVLHGHVFDEFIDAHPILTFLADWGYSLLQRVDRTHYVAKLAKHGSKTFLRCARMIEERSLAYARRKHCHAVCCGHTHVAKVSGADGIDYFNSGCWTELPCSYLTVAAGQVQLHRVEAGTVEEVVEPERLPLPHSAVLQSGSRAS